MYERKERKSVNKHQIRIRYLEQRKKVILEKESPFHYIPTSYLCLCVACGSELKKIKMGVKECFHCGMIYVDSDLAQDDYTKDEKSFSVFYTNCKPNSQGTHIKVQDQIVPDSNITGLQKTKNEKEINFQFAVLVDTENVKNAWVELLPLFGAEEYIKVYYTKHSLLLSMEDAQQMRESECTINTIHCSCGKMNELDFQLVTDLGVTSSEHPDACFVIFSRDHGFESVVNMLRKQGRNVRQAMTVKECINIWKEEKRLKKEKRSSTVVSDVAKQISNVKSFGTSRTQANKESKTKDISGVRIFGKPKTKVSEKPNALIRSFGTSQNKTSRPEDSNSFNPIMTQKQSTQNEEIIVMEDYGEYFQSEFPAKECQTRAAEQKIIDELPESDTHKAVEEEQERKEKVTIVEQEKLPDSNGTIGKTNTRFRQLSKELI